MTLSKKEMAALNRQIERAKRLEHLSCRIGGDRHRWHRCQPDFTPTFGRAIVHQCDTCLTIKRTVVAPKSGEILRRSYEYPDGYLVSRAEIEDRYRHERPISGQAVRVAMLGQDDSVLPAPTPIPREAGHANP